MRGSSLRPKYWLVLALFILIVAACSMAGDEDATDSEQLSAAEINDSNAGATEQRAAEEVTAFTGIQTAPAGVDVWNPAFDVTEAGDIAAIITEKGVIERPNTERISEHLSAPGQTTGTTAKEC